MKPPLASYCATITSEAPVASHLRIYNFSPGRTAIRSEKASLAEASAVTSPVTDEMVPTVQVLALSMPRFDKEASIALLMSGTVAKSLNTATDL